MFWDAQSRSCWRRWALLKRRAGVRRAEPDALHEPSAAAEAGLSDPALTQAPLARVFAERDAGEPEIRSGAFPARASGRLSCRDSPGLPSGHWDGARVPQLTRYHWLAHEPLSSARKT
jgi:hypothetical protein